MEVIAGAMVGAIMGLGGMLVMVGLVGVEWSTYRRRQDPIRTDLTRWLLRLTAGLAAGVLIFLVTGWFTAAFMIGSVVAAAPALMGGQRRRAEQIAKVEGIAGWAEALRDILSASAGVQEAVQTSSNPRIVAPAIAAPVGRLSSRMQHGDPRLALNAFAEELADPVCDLVVAALRMALTRQAGQLSAVLSEAASSARSAATMRAKIEATRARAHTSVQITIAITLGFMLLLLVFQREYLEPFDSAGGQVILTVIGIIFGIGVWGVARLSRMSALPRLIKVEASGR